MTPEHTQSRGATEAGSLGFSTQGHQPTAQVPKSRSDDSCLPPIAARSPARNSVRWSSKTVE
ncbi:hypothetical protein RISK_003650 [Rhodopirellula islandica]|uniref:Uncharacterized protein n=1 Tax=Rhodopirellula islandica TaxID=595434 RepID=A0A0J1EEW5_RHOIS|nr:hypothetical protein RISK_003650 [Rhodopirellula islandica]